MLSTMKATIHFLSIFLMCVLSPIFLCDIVAQEIGAVTSNEYTVGVEGQSATENKKDETVPRETQRQKKDFPAGAQVKEMKKPEALEVMQQARTNEIQPVIQMEEISRPKTQIVVEMLPPEEIAGIPEKAAYEEPAGVSLNLITISLDEVPVPDVVDMFTKVSGANIIVAGVFADKFITASLKDVEWKSALKLLLGSVGLSMIEDPSGIIMVVTSEMYQEKLKQIEETKLLVTKVFKLKYLNAVDLVTQIKKLNLLSPRGTIITSQSKEQHSASLKSSALATVHIQNPSVTTEIIVTDIEEYVERVALLIKDLDKSEPQVFIEARIIDVIQTDSKKVGFDWEMLDHFGATIGLRDLKWSWSDDHLVENVVEKTDDKYDKRSLSDNINKRYDDIQGRPYEESRDITDTISRGRDIVSKYTDSIKDSTLETKTASAILTVSDASLFISALKRIANVHLISHPLIIVGNRVEAKIHVGERYPTVISAKTVDTTGGISRDSYSERVEWNDLGLTLWVIPEIDTDEGIIRLSVSPQISKWIKDIKTPQGSVYPVISTRHLSTRVSVPTAHTVVIGGLIDNTKSKAEKKVPVLGEIPLLKYLFTYTEDIIEKHNLIILLTPTILSETAPSTSIDDMAQETVYELENISLFPKKATAPDAGFSTPVSTLATNAPTVQPAESPLSVETK